MTTASDYRMIPIEAITKDSYQRDLDDAKVAKIVAHYDPRQEMAPKLSEFEPGAFRVVEGQHTVAAKARLGHREVFSHIVSVADVHDEAALFLAIDRGRTALVPIDHYRAALVAGESWAIDLRRVVEYERGLRIVRRAEGAHDVFAGITNARRIIAKAGAETLSTALDVALTAWPDPMTKGRVHGFLIEGIALLAHAVESQGGQFDAARFGASLGRYTPQDIRAQAFYEAARLGPTVGLGAVKVWALAVAKRVKPSDRPKLLPERWA